jgi:hypothetical protein
VQRILDLDLDFFLDGAAHMRPYDAGRLDAEDFPPWSTADATTFLKDRCNLTAKLPGFVVENHGELFPLWRDAIAAGELTPPFDVVHVDAHADLGLGDNSYVYLLTSLLFEQPQHRCYPEVGDSGLNDGSWLSFAVACRWISDLTYVFNTDEETPNDIHPYMMQAGDPTAAHLELPAVHKEDLDGLARLYNTPRVVQHLEPKVPFRAVPWRAFQATGRFDVVCLARSPAYTPAESDALFDEIRDRFIDETGFSWS